MSKRLTALVAVTTGCALATAAGRAQVPSQTTLTATVRATPAKAGTAKRPAGVKLATRLELTTPEGQDHPVLTGFDIWLGPGVAFRGAGIPSCSVATLSQGGPKSCPPGSFMGNGAFLPDPRLPMDFDRTGSITFLNAPGGRVAAWMVLQNPARVQAAAVGRIVGDAPGPWPHRLSFTIPAALQVVAGVPITPRGFTFAIGGKTYARTFVASTRCPAGGWAWKVRVHTASAAVLESSGRTPCHA